MNASIFLKIIEKLLGKFNPGAVGVFIGSLASNPMFWQAVDKAIADAEAAPPA